MHTFGGRLLVPEGPRGAGPWLLGALLAAGILLGCLCRTVQAQVGQFDRQEVDPHEEAYLVTPPGFARAGQPRTDAGPQAGRVQVRVVEEATDRLSPCRVNLVGSDGNFYYPPADRLAPYRLIGAWPEGMGNRPSKAPIRYFGRFFYSLGEFTAEVPPGPTRIEVWKGFEATPRTCTVQVASGQTAEAEIRLGREADVSALGYYSGDPHLHFRRATDDDDSLIFDLLEAEDIRYGQVLCYNDDTSRYQGRMDTQASPQLRGMGLESHAHRGPYHLLSGQEYRSGHYGHLNLYLRPTMVLEQQALDPNTWPVFGQVAEETRLLGGIAIHAHGGYAQEILADAALGTTQGVELLQFGLYRGIGLSGWYHLLNCGVAFPAVGASDYPACRKLGDSRTYVYHPQAPTAADWLAAMAQGRGFVTTGPLLLLEVNGLRPGDSLHLDEPGPTQVTATIRMRSEVAPVTQVQLIVSGQVHQPWKLEPTASTGQWHEFSTTLSLNDPNWIAARAFSVAPTGNPDAESHTNPVWIRKPGRTVYRAESVAWWLAHLDEQIASLRARAFPGQDRSLAYFLAARARLSQIEAAAGQATPRPTPPAGGP